MTASRSPTFIDALHTDHPAPDRADKMGLYGWLIGRWEMDTVTYGDDGSKQSGRGEIHFGWVLEGRAIQDVWILPGIFHGTTLRVYDPNIDAWHILWSDPVRQYYARQIGRGRGNDIVQEGKNDAGATLRWTFTDITPNSFRWLGERSTDGGATWQLQADFRAQRVQGSYRMSAAISGAASPRPDFAPLIRATSAASAALAAAMPWCGARS
jgi:hypothetical protein